MGFVVEKVGKGKHLPEGHYLKLNGIDWLITDITIDASANICLKLHDPLRKDNQIFKPMNLQQLLSGHPDIQIHEI